MYYQTGNMRQFNNDLSPLKNSNVWQRENEFQYAQRSKYERSEVSYGQPKSRIIYEEEKTDRFQKPSQNKQFVKVPIKIKSPDREDYIGNFRIQLLNASEKNSNYMKMHLTNDSDSLFLWSFLIRDNQFMVLKTQQQLKVDFHGFPDAINEFLGLCIKSQEDTSQVNPTLAYYVVFEIAKGNEQAQLKIIEVNKYKQSCHFNLKFKKANDEQLKIFLGQKYDDERKEKTKALSQLSEAQHVSNLRMQEIGKLRLQLEQLNKQSNARISELERKQKQSVKEATLRIEEENMQRQKDDVEKNKRRIDQLNTKIEQLKGKYQEVYKNFQKANERIITLEASQNSLKSKNSILEQQCEGFEKQNKELKSKQLKLSQDYHALRNENTKLSCTIQSLEDRLKEKDQRIVENIEAKSTNVNQISTLQEHLRQEKKKVEKLEEKNEHLQAEMAKLSRKNEDLYGKLQKKKDNIGDYKQILTMQQDKIDENQKQFKKMLEQIVELKRDRERIDLDLKDRQIKIKDLKGHIEQNQQHMENQKKIITELNKKLNQKGIGVKSFTLPSTLPTYPGLGGTGLGLGATNSMIGRQYSSTISSTSQRQSRMKYSPSPITTASLNEKATERIVPPFRKYREGVENDRDQQNSHHSHSHSRSPIVNRLNQQADPEDADKTRQKIGPIKFKK